MGSTVLCMIPDTGERYLSTPLFDAVSEQMSEEEQAIAASTDGYRMGAPTSPPAAAAPPAMDVNPEAVRFVDRSVNDREQPVVMFALEWCEFCWALHKFFRAQRIPYRSIDLDSVLYQKDNIGGEIRKVLHARLGSPTIPQVFVGGRPIGGCTDTLDQFRAGTLQALLAECNVPFVGSDAFDPSQFLPKWVHPR